MPQHRNEEINTRQQAQIPATFTSSVSDVGTDESAVCNEANNSHAISAYQSSTTTNARIASLSVNFDDDNDFYINADDERDLASVIGTVDILFCFLAMSASVGLMFQLFYVHVAAAL